MLAVSSAGHHGGLNLPKGPCLLRAASYCSCGGGGGRGGVSVVCGMWCI